jgi:hypothetical protein
VDTNCQDYAWTADAPNSGLGGFCAVGGNCCYLKSTQVAPNPYSIVYSGIKVPGSGSCSTGTVSFTGYDLAGGDWKSFPLGQSDCYQYCCASSTCVGYAWSSDAPNAGIGNDCTVGGNCCYLKSSIASYEANSVVNSAVKTTNGVPVMSFIEGTGSFSGYYLNAPNDQYMATTPSFYTFSLVSGTTNTFLISQGGYYLTADVSYSGWTTNAGDSANQFEISFVSGSTNTVTIFNQYLQNFNGYGWLCATSTPYGPYLPYFCTSAQNFVIL